MSKLQMTGPAQRLPAHLFRPARGPIPWAPTRPEGLPGATSKRTGTGPHKRTLLKATFFGGAPKAAGLYTLTQTHLGSKGEGGEPSDPASPTLANAA